MQLRLNLLLAVPAVIGSLSSALGAPPAPPPPTIRMLDIGKVAPAQRLKFICDQVQELKANRMVQQDKKVGENVTIIELWACPVQSQP